MTKISIIIPIYNSETNLDKCLNSIAKQEYADMEVLCINDGSKDNSEQIIKKYCKKDKRFKLISKENTGVSDTRNCGIRNATGNYIMFIDADDYIDKEYVAKMIQCAEKQKADIVISAYTEVKNNQNKQMSIHNQSKNKTFDITYPKETKNYLSTFEYNPCWKQLIKRDLLLQNNIMFNTNIKYGEDMLFSFQCYVKSQKTIYYKIFGYYYYINNESVMSRKDVKSLNKHFIDNFNITEIIMNNYNISETEKEELYYKTLRIYNKISWKMIYGTKKYSIWKKNIKQARTLYENYFSNLKIRKRKINKNNIFLFMLKYKMYCIYYFIQITSRKITKKY